MEYISPVASLVQCFCRQDCIRKSVSKQCHYLDKPKEILGRLDEQMRVLNARETDVRRMLSYGMMQHDMEPKAEVELWLENVGKIKDSVNKIKQDGTEDKRCLISCIPNYYFRLKLGNVVDEKIHEVNKLLEQGKFSESAVVGKLPQRGKTLPTTVLMGETAKRNIERILDYVMDENTGTIGIFGMGGVGKTTIMMEINNQLMRNSMCFDSIIWVTATSSSDLPKLQNNIAKAIGLCFDDNDDTMTRSAKLWQALMRHKKFLLIIDDLWEAFSLQEVGIPNPAHEKVCKLVITTRSLSVCRGMETVKEVEVELLSTNEAWDLFKHKVGEEVVSSLRIEAVAKDIAKECGGLPLAICTVGRALRKQFNVRKWLSALRELQNSTASIEGMENQVFARLKFSYDRLKDNITRSCFLYCAMYPKDHHIDIEELIRYWIYDGLLGNLGDMESQMQQGHIIVDELKNACMLDCVYQDGCADEYVKMHDLIRDTALSLTRVKPLFMVRAGLGICMPPLEDEWHPDLEKISLMRNDLSNLNCEPRCPRLSTLLLQYNSISKGIGPHFFNHMQKLQVLDLSYTGIYKLPDSFSSLVNLWALLLCSCWNLHYVPTLENLKKLRVLDLSYSSIEHIPHGMEMLVNLRRLDLSYSKLNEFPLISLPRYKMLENLMFIGVWHTFDLGKMVVEVVTSCINLSILEANFSNFVDFSYYIMSGHWSQLECFKFCIGFPDSSVSIGRNGIAFVGINLSERESPAWLPGRMLELGLFACSGITCLPEFITSASSELQRCKLQHCDDMRWIITSGWSTFPNLECLQIMGLRKLRSLCKRTPEEGTLANLKVLHIIACNIIRNSLSFALVQNLKNLEEIVVEDCKRIEEIIGDGSKNEEVTEVSNAEVVLPQLRKLRLRSLPRLRRICRNVMTCDSLSAIEVVECPELKTLPLIHSLKQIKVSRKWYEELKESHPDCIRLRSSLFREEPESSAANQNFGSGDDRYSGASASSSFGPR